MPAENVDAASEPRRPYQLRLPDAPVSFSEAAPRLGIGTSTLREWCRKKYFPEPKRHNRAPWLTDHQVMLIGKLKECLRVNKMRPASIKIAALKEVRASIAENWH